MQADRNSSVRARSRADWPLSKVLVDGVHPATTARVWNQVRARLDGAAGGKSAGRVGPWLARSLGAFAAALLVLGLGAVVGRGAVGQGSWLQRIALLEKGESASQGAGVVTGPLSVPEMNATGSKAPVAQALTDGSRIVAEPGARLRTLASTAKDLVLQLQSGKAHFNVRPGGARRWVIEAGVVQVEVVGTEFSVERVKGGACVEVTRGVVLVRSRELKDGVERLEGGARLTVGKWPDDSERVKEETSTELVAGEAAVDAGEAAVEAGGAAKEAGQAAKEAGEAEAKGAVLAQATRNKALARERWRQKKRRPSIEKLLEQADEARISGDRSAAQRVLQRVVQEFPADPRAAVSAFQLGALELELGLPQRAVASLSLALERAGSLSLREDCYLRLVEAQLAAGSVGRAQRVAASYSIEFPDGRHQGALERLLRRSRTKKSATLATKSR